MEPSRFLYYDRSFRSYFRSHNLRWGKIEQDLWLKAVSLNPSSSKANHSSALNQANNASKVCFRYNRQSGCQDRLCKYAHACKYCSKKGHPEYRCFAKQRNDPKSQSAPLAPSGHSIGVSQNQSFRSHSNK